MKLADQLRKEASEIRRLASLPVQAAMKQRMIEIAARFDELAAQRDRLLLGRSPMLPMLTHRGGPRRSGGDR